MTTMPNFTQFVSLVSKGGVPVMLADAFGNPYPTTGFGSLVFNEGATLSDVTYTGILNAIDGVHLPPGSPTNPSLAIGIPGENDTGLYSPAPGIFGVAANGVPSATFDSTGIQVQGDITYSGVLHGAYHSPLTTRGDLYYFGASGPTRLGLGDIGTVLMSNGSDLVYVAAAGGTVTSIAGVVNEIVTLPAPITATGTIGLANTAVTPGIYGDATHSARITVDQKGRLTAVTAVPLGAGGTVTSVAAGTGLSASPSPIVGAGTMSLADTLVSPGSYGDATHVSTFTVDQQGRLTAAGSVVLNFLPLGGGTLTGPLNGTVGNFSATITNGYATLVPFSAYGGTSNLTPTIQSATAFPSLSLQRYATGGNGPVVNLSKSGSATLGVQTLVGANDFLGEINFNGSDGVKFVEGAFIRAEIDSPAVPALNDMPTRITFGVSADGTVVPVEAMRIASNKTVTMAGALATSGNVTITGSSVSGGHLLFNDTNTGGQVWQVGPGAGSGSPDFWTIYNQGTTTSALSVGKTGGISGGTTVQAMLNFSTNFAGTAYGRLANSTNNAVYLDTELSGVANGYCFWGVNYNAGAPRAEITPGAGLPGGLLVTSALTVSGAVTGTTATWSGAEKTMSGTAIPAGGTAGAGYLFSSTANFGTIFGSGVPTASMARGSLYLRSDGGGPYVNTDGATAWSALQPQTGTLRLYDEQVLGVAGPQMVVTIPAGAKVVELDFYATAASDFLCLLQAMQSGVANATNVYFAQIVTAAGSGQANTSLSGPIGGINLGTASTFSSRVTLRQFGNLWTGTSAEWGIATAGTRFNVTTAFDFNLAGVTGFRVFVNTGAPNLTVGSYLRCLVVT